MPSIKNIVCLANSYRTDGHCFAGKEVTDNKFGGWIRPVSARNSEEISPEEQELAGGGFPKLLDVVAVPLLTPKPTGHQKENHLIRTGNDVPQWEKIGEVGRQTLPELVDNVSGALWRNGNQSDSGVNNRVLASDAENFDYSLLLIRPASLTITVDWKRDSYGRQIRAVFNYEGEDYNLSVTDPSAIDRYTRRSKSDYHEHGHELPLSYPITQNEVYMCVSLGEKFFGHCYKLVAAIIGDEE